MHRTQRIFHPKGEFAVNTHKQPTFIQRLYTGLAIAFFAIGALSFAPPSVFDNTFSISDAVTLQVGRQSLPAMTINGCIQGGHSGGACGA